MIWIDVYPPGGGSKLGPGPVTAVTGLESRSKLSAAGDWRITTVADARSALLQPGRVALIWGATGANGATEFLGGGPVEAVQQRIGENGVALLEVNGGDLLTELAFATAGYAETSDAKATLAAALPSGWTLIETDTLPAWSARYSHDSLLAAYVRAAGEVGFRFRLAPVNTGDVRRIEFLTETPASSVRAAQVNAAEIGSTAVCALRSLTQTQRSVEIVNRMYIYGAGNWATRGTLRLANAWPDGSALSGAYTDEYGNTWTVDVDESRIDCTSSQAAFGVRSGAVQFGSIAPLTNSTADMRSAANFLLRAALAQMAPLTAQQEAYALEVEALTAGLLPGDAILVDARHYVDGSAVLQVDRDLVVLEVVRSWQPGGLLRRRLTVATTAAMPASDGAAVAKLLQGTINAAALPQQAANVDTICASDALDDDASAAFRFWLGEETGQVFQVLLRFRVDPLRSTAKAIGGTASGSVDIPDHTHDVTVAAHTHSVTVPSHDHDIPDHEHRIGLSQGSGGRNVGIYTGGGLYYEGTDEGVLSVYTTSDSGSTTSDSGGGSTPTSSSGGGATVTSAAGGAEVGLEVDISNALELEYGIFEESGANTYAASDIAWTCNGDAVTETPAALVDGWYSLDLTEYVVDTDGVRPAAAANVVTAAIKVASHANKTCQVTVQIERRTSIQPIAYR